MPASDGDFPSLLSSLEECARLFHDFCPSSSSMPSPADLIFSQSYVEWASFETQVSSLLIVVVFLPFVFALFDRFGLPFLVEGEGKFRDRSV